MYQERTCKPGEIGGKMGLFLALAIIIFAIYKGLTQSSFVTAFFYVVIAIYIAVYVFGIFE